MDFPPVMALSTDLNTSCLCPTCLGKEINQFLIKKIKGKERNALIKKAKQYKEDKLQQGLDYTLEGDKMVFTPWFLLKQGKCCKKNCLNCPYKHLGVV